MAIVVALLPPTLEFFSEVGTRLPHRHRLVSAVRGPELRRTSALAGTLVITVIAVIVCVPLGLGSAIYLSEYASDRVRKTFKPILEVLAGIPTVVYGFFALQFVTPFPQSVLPFQVEIYNALSAGLVMGIMIIPTIASLSEDAMSAVPNSLRDGAYALGSTKRQVATRVGARSAVRHRRRLRSGVSAPSGRR